MRTHYGKISHYNVKLKNTILREENNIFINYNHFQEVNLKLFSALMAGQTVDSCADVIRPQPARVYNGSHAWS
jgi:hypothetical protein